MKVFVKTKHLIHFQLRQLEVQEITLISGRLIIQDPIMTSVVLLIVRIHLPPVI